MAIRPRTSGHSRTCNTRCVPGRSSIAPANSGEGTIGPTGTALETRVKLLREVSPRPFAGTAQLPEFGLALDPFRQDRDPHVVDCHQAPRRATAPLESSLNTIPVTQRHMPRALDTAAPVIDEPVIRRAPRRDQPTNRQ